MGRFNASYICAGNMQIPPAHTTTQIIYDGTAGNTQLQTALKKAFLVRFLVVKCSLAVHLGLAVHRAVICGPLLLSYCAPRGVILPDLV
jgi:hypothetical protein